MLLARLLVGALALACEGMPSVTEPSKSVTLVVLTPPTASTIVGQTMQLTAALKDAQGIPLPGRTVTWTSSDAGVATVSPTGLVTGVAAGGPVTITATSEGQSDSARITVSAVSVASVTVVPASASLKVGAVRQLDATPRDAHGDPVSGRTLTWRTSDASVATVDTTGVVTGVAAGGPVTVTATSEGQSDSASITVTAMPVASVTVVPASASLKVGATQQLDATPRDAQGDPISGRTLTWGTSDASVATVDATGVVTGVAAGGPVTITATSEGQSGSANITVTVIAGAVASVTVAPASASVTVGGTQQLTATPKDAQGNPLSGRAITWTTSDAGVATVNADGLVTGVAGGGPLTITATSEGQSGSASITVTAVSVSSVTVAPTSTSLTVGATQQLTATPKDAQGNPLFGRAITWATSNAGVATVNPNGLVTAVAAGGPVTITATSEGRSGTAMITVSPVSTGPGPLRVGSSPYFFTDGSGRAVYLTGSHTWMNFQDAGRSDPPPAFNWSAYLDFLQQLHHNAIKLWRWESPRWSAESPNDLWYGPMPYLRPGPGTALDGKPKFDLAQFSPAYFARMRQRVVEAGQRGIYVVIMLFDGWSIEDKNMGNRNPWLGHPFNRTNNINGIDGDPNGDDQGLETHTLQVPALVALQEAYVRQVVDAVNDLDNVLYEISNESRSGAEAWQEHMILYVKQYEAGKPKQHPVGMTASYPGDGNNPALYASSADWIAPKDSPGNPTLSDGRKVILNDTDHDCGVCFDGPWVWKSLTRGLNPIFMDPYDGTYPVTAQYDLNDPALGLVRRNMGYARTYADRMNLAVMRPSVNLASTGYCLANPGAEYLVYAPPNGTAYTFYVDLTATNGTLTVEWFDPSTGQASSGGTVAGGAVRSFTTPTNRDAVLYLH